MKYFDLIEIVTIIWIIVLLAVMSNKIEHLSGRIMLLEENNRIISNAMLTIQKISLLNARHIIYAYPDKIQELENVWFKTMDQ